MPKTKSERKDEELVKLDTELMNFEAQRAEILKENETKLSTIDEKIEHIKFKKEAIEKVKT